MGRASFSMSMGVTIVWRSRHELLIPQSSGVITVPLRTMAWGRGQGWLKQGQTLESDKPVLESWPSLPAAGRCAGRKVSSCVNGQTLVPASQEWREDAVTAWVL